MKVTTKIKISENFVNQIKQGISEDELIKFLKEEIPEVELRLFLQQYKHWSGTLGTADKKKIVEAQISTNGKGWFLVDYDLEFTFGCSNENASSKEKMKILISVDFNNRILTLTGEEQPERLPDDI